MGAGPAIPRASSASTRARTPPWIVRTAAIGAIAAPCEYNDDRLSIAALPEHWEISSMAAVAADRNLLFGLLALQNGLINQVQLVAAFQAWTLDKARALADHLIALGHLNDAQRSAVEVMADLHVAKHG